MSRWWHKVPRGHLSHHPLPPRWLVVDGCLWVTGLSFLVKFRLICRPAPASQRNIVTITLHLPSELENVGFCKWNQGARDNVGDRVSERARVVAVVEEQKVLYITV